MTEKLGVREISRNFNILSQYDYVEIEDKKTHSSKGLFVSERFAQEVKEYLDEKLKVDKQKKIDEMMQVVGKCDIDSSYNNLSSSEVKRRVAESKHD